MIVEIAAIYINEGQPKRPGLYVAYVNDEFAPRYAGKKLLMWFDGKWSYPMSDQNYRGHIYGWIGPLPAMELNE